MLQVGYKIKKFRELKNLTQEYLASELNINTKTYANIENDKAELTLSRLEEIAKILSIDPIALLNFDEKQFFNNCNQSGNMNHIYNDNFANEREAYQKQISHLQEEVSFLRGLVGSK